MADITNIPDQLTPARPVEITFAAETGLPSANQELAIIGHAASGVPVSGLYLAKQVTNAGDLEAAETELNAKYGSGSELTKMVLAAILANQAAGTFVAIKAIPLASTDTGFGSSDQALRAVEKIKAEFVVSPYSGQDTTTRDKLKTSAALMSGPSRTANNQFGTFGVIANLSVSDPSTLFKFDTQYLIGVWLRDGGTLGVNPYSIGEVAAASAAKMAGNGSPFNPLDDETIPGVPSPLNDADWISVGAQLESESALTQGWTPLRVKPNGEVSFVRTVTGRKSPSGSGTPLVTAYYDVQDFQVLYLWRKTLYSREAQDDFRKAKASNDVAKLLKSELIRLAKIFEANSMFQAVDQLAKKFIVQRSQSDRSRFDVKTPVNVIPGLHVIANNIEATTEFDELTL
jgi:phage tail sheath gpL-like